MKIKSIALFFLLFLSLSGYSQSIKDVKSHSQVNVTNLQDRIRTELPNTVFTSNQTVKLEKIYMDINKQKVELADARVTKSEYATKSMEIEKKYESLIATILTEDQRIVYENIKNKNSIN